MVRSEITQEQDVSVYDANKILKEEEPFGPLPKSVIKQRVIGLRSSDIYMTMSDIAREVGISRQRTYQILKKARLPTRHYSNKTQYQCLVCGTVSARKLCSIKCRKEWQQIPIVCTGCGKLFTRNKSALLASYHHNQVNIFCSKYCQGKWAGEHYGFKAHVNLANLGRVRKYNWDDIWKTHLETRYGAPRLSRKLGIPESTIAAILRHYPKNSKDLKNKSF